MKDSVLKKEFKKEDVTRIRNLVQGKFGEKTRTSVGFSKKQKFHKEGDIWEEDGRTWTIKKGVKQNVTKLDKAKKLHQFPLLCPKCNNPMKKKIDGSFYKVHRMCLNCVVDLEHELKKKGEWEDYERRIHNNEIDKKIQEYKAWVEEKVNESNDGFVSEAGVVERWKGKINKELNQQSVTEVVDYLNSLKK